MFRHYVQDKGKFPKAMMEDLHLEGSLPPTRAGILPYVALVAGAAVVLIANLIFHL